MKINNLKHKTTQRSSILSADIVVENKKPVNIYFEVDRRFSDYIYVDYSPFYTSMVLPAMARRSDLVIKGSISRKLYQNNAKMQKLLVGWGGFNHIHIDSKTTVDFVAPKIVACFFSLGVDSFYTYLKNKSLSGEKISHFILVHGFDVRLEDNKLFNEMKNNILKISKKENIKLISVKTNLRELSDQYLSWDWEHGSALAAVALLLRRGLKKVYVAGPHSKSQLVPLGLHPDLDYLWSSEHMNIIHDGANHTRLEKIKLYISKSSLALNNLKVCWKNTKGRYNCGKCNKCIRTMVDLKLSDALEKVKTFPTRLSLNDVKNVYSPGSDTIVFIEDSLQEIIKQKRYPELQHALEHSLKISRNPSVKRSIIENIGYLDRKYNKRRLYLFLSQIGVNL